MQRELTCMHEPNPLARPCFRCDCRDRLRRFPGEPARRRLFTRAREQRVGSVVLAHAGIAFDDAG